jgi:gluconokinase
MNVPHLRSPYAKTGGIMYFARMLDKVRLHAAEVGLVFGGELAGGSDEEILEWACAQGRRPSAEEIEIWNEFMRKRGWNDEASARLAQRKHESGLADRTDIQTFFDYIDADEGRPVGGA